MLAMPGMPEAIAAAGPGGGRQPLRGRRGAQGPDARVLPLGGHRAAGAGLTQAYGDLLDGVVADEPVEGVAASRDGHADGHARGARESGRSHPGLCGLSARCVGVSGAPALVATPPPRMRTIAILPIKSLGAAKQRLSGQLGGESSETLAPGDVLRRAGHPAPRGRHPRDRGGHRQRRGRVGRARQRRVGDPSTPRKRASAAAGLGIHDALAAGHERVLLVPGDTPLLDSDELTGMLDRAEAGGTSATIVPDRHGEGTNALLLSPPTAIEPSFGPGSLARHLAARAAGPPPRGGAGRPDARHRHPR